MKPIKSLHKRLIKHEIERIRLKQDIVYFIREELDNINNKELPISNVIGYKYYNNDNNSIYDVIINKIHLKDNKLYMSFVKADGVWQDKPLEYNILNANSFEDVDIYATLLLKIENYMENN